jgi:hypothetical protein
MATSTYSDIVSRTMRANHAVPDPMFIQDIVTKMEKASVGAAAAAGSDDSGCNFPVGSVVAVRSASTYP